MTTAASLLGALALLAQQPTPPRSPDAPGSPGLSEVVPVPSAAEIEAEVLHNLRSQPLGSGTVEDLNLPEPFLRRVAARIVRASYEERYRIVVKEEAPANAAASKAGASMRSIGSAVIIGLMVFVLAMAGLVGVLLKRRAARRNA